jgi:hypothetical protein
LEPAPQAVKKGSALLKTQYTPGGVKATASSNDVVSEGLGLLWGADAIGKFLGINRRRTFYLLQSKRIPARKLGATWVATREPPRPTGDPMYEAEQARQHYENASKQMAERDRVLNQYAEAYGNELSRTVAMDAEMARAGIAQNVQQLGQLRQALEYEIATKYPESANQDALNQMALQNPTRFKQMLADVQLAKDHITVQSAHVINHAHQREAETNSRNQYQDARFIAAHPELQGPEGDKARRAYGQAAIEWLKSRGMTDEMINHEYTYGQLRTAEAQELLLSKGKEVIAQRAMKSGRRNSGSRPPQKPGTRVLPHEAEAAAAEAARNRKGPLSVREASKLKLLAHNRRVAR